MTENHSMDGLRAFLLAGDDERRAVERELHDGAQQQLVAIAVNVQIAQGLVESDPPSALRLLDDVRAGIAETLDELRRLAQRIHPPLLDSQGLVAALRMAAAAAPIPTRVEGAVEGAVPPEVAVTVYRACVATLAAAHGEGDATVAVAARDGVLEFEVSLAGARIAPGSLDLDVWRVENLGGTLTVTSDRTAGRLPLSS